ncbi:hypothetical protein [Nocardia sp. NPDC050710]|uniref:hypothetical protein n=1 Tax=Nocardia sp. NPDC050710 TaxID=3157220 RepID=UPI0033EEEBCB
MTHAAEDGASTPVLMKLSGHTSVRSLAKYARVSDEGLRRYQADSTWLHVGDRAAESWATAVRHSARWSSVGTRQPASNRAGCGISGSIPNSGCIPKDW